MTQFRRAFALWFATFIAIFLALNLAGFALHGTKGHHVGFPCAIAEWIEVGEYRESNFYPDAILIDAFIATAISALVAIVCAASRARHNAKAQGANERNRNADAACIGNPRHVN
jgi:hypothetical protein